jgi:hypothetical protein
MQTQELDREEQWIAKYRAALDASPKQPSGFHQLALTWENFVKFTTSVPLTFCLVRRAIDRVQSLKGWLKNRFLEILRHNNRRQTSYIEKSRRSFDFCSTAGAMVEVGAKNSGKAKIANCRDFLNF